MAQSNKNISITEYSPSFSEFPDSALSDLDSHALRALSKITILLFESNLHLHPWARFQHPVFVSISGVSSGPV